MKIGFLGPEKSFTWEAAVRSLKGEYIAMESLSSIFEGVERGYIDLGVVPFINSLEGPVGEVIDNLAIRDPFIVKVVEMRITLCLAIRGIPKIIYTHPHAAGQARKKIAELGSQIVFTRSTSEAVEIFKKGCTNCGVIASPKAMEDIDDKICGIEDSESRTRFAIASKYKEPWGRYTHTAIIFTVPNRPGSLYKALSPIAEASINMSFIYSRPTRLSPWQYFFLAELECYGCDDAIEGMRRYTTSLKIVGKYSIDYI
jgi:prephenate dehydratase